MQTVKTKYGMLRGITSLEHYQSGELEECMMSERNEIATSCGVLIPQYQDDGVRRKYTKSMSFYKDGNLKSIALQEQTNIQTPIGVFPAELITFYENGNIKRFFPLNGKLSGYWSEENEYELAPELDFSFSVCSFRKKVIGVYFYESGSIKSVTLWPKEVVTVESPLGNMEAHVGISFYPEGNLKSIEPNQPEVVKTPIGEIAAYNVNIVGIHGDTNSLCFYNDGRIKSLVTSTDKIVVVDGCGKKTIFTPKLKPSLLDNEKMDIQPVLIEFYDGWVRFNNDMENVYEIEKNSFSVKNLSGILNPKCSSCAGCQGCG